MGPRAVMVADVATYELAQVCLAQHAHVIQAFPPKRPDEALGVGVLPRRSGTMTTSRRSSFLNG